jgi:hypothetical protein
MKGDAGIARDLQPPVAICVDQFVRLGRDLGGSRLLPGLEANGATEPSA